MSKTGYKILDDVWLTEVLARPVSRIEIEDLDSVDVISKSLTTMPKGAFCYVKVDTTNSSLVSGLIANGFLLVETALTFDKARSIHEIQNKINFRNTTNQDKASVIKIAAETFSYSRFHKDEKIGNLSASKVKAEWVSNFYNGKRGSHMIVAEVENQVAGFLQIISSGDTFVIDLIGVSQQFQRRGIARGLIQFAENNLRQFNTVVVGTQIINTASVRLYESMGFKLKSSNHVLHWHNC